MTGQEIQTLVTQNNKKIFELIEPCTFILNSEIESLIKENQILQKQCPHEFIYGKCKFCGKEEAL